MNGIVKRIVKVLFHKSGYEYIQKWYWKVRRQVKKLERWILLAILYPAIYYLFSRKRIGEKKAIFVEVRLEKISDSLYLLHKEMEKREYEIHDHYLKSGFVTPLRYVWNCMQYVKDIADAKYIFISDAVNILGRIKLRKETKMVQTWHGCGAFKKFGYSTCDLLFGPSRKELETYPTSNNYTFVTVSSPEVIWAYQEAMGISVDKILPLGISRTDVFFDREFLKAAKERVRKCVPESVKKR